MTQQIPYYGNTIRLVHTIRRMIEIEVAYLQKLLPWMYMYMIVGRFVIVAPTFFSNFPFILYARCKS